MCLGKDRGWSEYHHVALRQAHSCVRNTDKLLYYLVGIVHCARFTPHRCHYWFSLSHFSWFNAASAINPTPVQCVWRWHAKAVHALVWFSLCRPIISTNRQGQEGTWRKTQSPKCLSDVRWLDATPTIPRPQSVLTLDLSRLIWRVRISWPISWHTLGVENERQVAE